MSAWKKVLYIPVAIASIIASLVIQVLQEVGLAKRIKPCMGLNTSDLDGGICGIPSEYDGKESPRCAQHAAADGAIIIVHDEWLQLVRDPAPTQIPS